MFFEKRLTYNERFGAESVSRFRGAGGGRLDFGTVESMSSTVAPDTQAEQKIDAETESIVLQFMEFTFENDSDLFDSEKAKNFDLTDVTTAITSPETKAAIKSKLQDGYAFDGYTKDKLKILWQKDGVKHLQVNPMVLNSDIRPLLNANAERKLRALLDAEDLLNLLERTKEERVKKDFVKICKRLIDDGFINADKVRGSEFEEDLKDVLRAIYMKAGKGKFDASFDASALIVFDDAGFTLKSADYFGKDIQVSFAIGEREYDESLNRMAMETGPRSAKAEGRVEDGAQLASLADMMQEVAESFNDVPDFKKLSDELEEVQSENEVQDQPLAFEDAMAELDEWGPMISAQEDFGEKYAEFHPKMQNLLQEARKVVEEGKVSSEEELGVWVQNYLKQHGETSLEDQWEEMEEYSNKYFDSPAARYLKAMRGMAKGFFPNEE